MEELLNTLERTDFDNPQECFTLIEALEKELNNLSIGAKIDSNHLLSTQEIDEGRAELLAFLHTATFAISLIPSSIRSKSNIMGRLQRFVNKILTSLKKYAQKLNVDTYSITVGISPSITLTFRP